MVPVSLHFPIPISRVYSRKCFKLKQFSLLPPKIALYDMHAYDVTGHHDAGYSYDTGHQNVCPSHMQLTKAALIILIYDKDLSSGCTLHAEKD